MADDTTVAQSIEIDKPQRGAKDGYLQAYFQASQQMNRVIAESNGISDHRIRLLTLKMIAGITEDGIRKQVLEFFDTEIAKIENTSGLSADEKNQQIANFCCGEMQGHIVAWYDQFMGITHRLRLGEA